MDPSPTSPSSWCRLPPSWSATPRSWSDSTREPSVCLAAELLSRDKRRLPGTAGLTRCWSLWWSYLAHVGSLSIWLTSLQIQLISVSYQGRSRLIYLVNLAPGNQLVWLDFPQLISISSPEFPNNLSLSGCSINWNTLSYTTTTRYFQNILKIKAEDI